MKKILVSAIALFITLTLTFVGRSDGQEPAAPNPTTVGSETPVTQNHKHSESTHIELLDIGDYYTDQGPLRASGEKWLGLDVGRSSLDECQIKVKTSNQGEGTQEMHHVSVDPPIEPLFLVRGVELSAGAVITLFAGNWEKSLDEKSPLNFRLGTASYELKVVRSEDTATCEEGLPLNARLLLTSGENRQVLYSLVDCGGGAAWHVLWAGDLDRDGRLDLFVNVSPGDYGGSRKLFLSSKAQKGRLVKEVAELVSYGC